MPSDASSGEDLEPFVFTFRALCAWYLAGSNVLCGTRLGMAVVNTSFQRLFLASSQVLLVEVPESLLDRIGGEPLTMNGLDAWTELWDGGMPHNYFPNGSLDPVAFGRYFETFAQGVILTSRLPPSYTEPVSPELETATVNGPPLVGDMKVLFNALSRLQASTSERSKRKRGSSTPTTTPPKRQITHVDGHQQASFHQADNYAASQVDEILSEIDSDDGSSFDSSEDERTLCVDAEDLQDIIKHVALVSPSRISKIIARFGALEGHDGTTET